MKRMLAKLCDLKTAVEFAEGAAKAKLKARIAALRKKLLVQKAIVCVLLWNGQLISMRIISHSFVSSTP